MTADGHKVLLRYWGSYFKNPRQVDYWRKMLSPAVHRGWRCYLALERPPEDASWLESIVREGIEPVFVKRPRRHFDFRCARAVQALCRSLKADFFHCENLYTSPLIGAAMAGVPVRLWTKQTMQESFAECRSATLRDRIAVSTRVSCALATRVLAASQAVADELTALGVAPQRVVVRHLPRAELGSVSADRVKFREALGYASKDVVVVTVGRAVPVKGWDVLLRAFKKVSSAHPSARLLLLGSNDSPYERDCFSELNAFVQQQGLSGTVRFAGHVSKELPDYLHAADVFVLPSRSEACSFALLEAVETGLPCVATRVGAAAQTIQDGTNGFLVPRLDVEELAARLALLVEDDALRAQFARAARVPESFPRLDEFGDQLCRLYTSLLPDTDLHLNGASKKTA